MKPLPCLIEGFFWVREEGGIGIGLIGMADPKIALYRTPPFQPHHCDLGMGNKQIFLCTKRKIWDKLQK